MSGIDIVALTRALVDIDSTTGREGDAGRLIATSLRGHGFAVTEQRVDDGGDGQRHRTHPWCYQASTPDCATTGG